MIDIETLARLKEMRLSGMAEYFENLADTTATATVTLTGPEMVKQAVDWEHDRRRDSKLHRLRRQAGLAQPGADIADIKAMPGRSMDTELIARLAIGSYLVKHQDVILQGPTGAGKTYVASALGNKACQQYRKVLYLSADELFDRITIAERTGDKKRCLDTLVKVELLIIDDWFLTTPTRQQVQQLHTLIDRRHKTASTIYCTQLPPAQWHDRMDEKILADAIVDRITTNAHATVLHCDDSMRKHFNQIWIVPGLVDRGFGFRDFGGIIMGSTRRSFTAEYKASAVAFVLDEGRQIVEVARNIGVHEMTLGKWVKKERDAREAIIPPDASLTMSERAELIRLREDYKTARSENAQLRMEAEFAKKVATWFANDQQ